MSYYGFMDGWILGLIALLLAVLFFYMSGQFSRLFGRLQGEHEQEALRMQRVEDMLHRLEKELRDDVEAVRLRVDGSLDKHTQAMNSRLKELIEANEQRLREISGKVEERLDKGFEKTTSVFSEVQQRLALIDKAQQEMASLSGNVVSLKEILADKRSRGAFGEVQLSGLITNVMPPESYAEQYTFASGVRADCVLFLPEPTGTLCIDAKFPLESFQRMVDPDVAEVERKQAEKQFALDIKKHIKDIAEKYIIPGETADGAVMFIPAEAVFAEIHARFPEVVSAAQQARVWLTSPTTMMAVLTTSRAVLKDAATRKQVHIIQEHLVALSKDFERFEKRMGNLAKHIDQANRDVEEVHTSARKITSRFEKIEQVDIEPPQALDQPED
jgi:DNA recombination protein RmuC